MQLQFLDFFFISSGKSDIFFSGYFEQMPVGPMPQILALAEFVDKVHAVCVCCGGLAHYSQRIAGGQEQVQVGDTEAYEARCRNCYEPFVAE